LVDKPDTSCLVWTTTPWTLPANVAVAAHPDVEYVTVERDNNGTKEKLILAKSLLEKVFRGEEVKVVDSFKGKKLKGLKYKPLFTFVPVDKPAYYVVLADFVTTEDGTGTRASGSRVRRGRHGNVEAVRPARPAYRPGGRHVHP
jgi:isoleucyl-tRNA synthetase